MQITKYWITEFSNPLDSYKKFYNALRVKGIPLIKEDYNNGFFEVNSTYAPSVISVSTVTGIPIQFVSTRTTTTTTTKPTPRPVVNPIPTPSPSPVVVNPSTDTPKPTEKDNAGSNLLLASVFLVFIVVSSGKKKKGRR